MCHNCYQDRPAALCEVFEPICIGEDAFWDIQEDEGGFCLACGQLIWYKFSECPHCASENTVNMETAYTEAFVEIVANPLEEN